ncbi:MULTISPECIES: hypothetical protein [Moorena]|uniref:UDP-N-acetyl-alpha-D-muramoyl-L-alanyl-L-glutamate epimerase n=2 Tax=Moorena TaxID=1155738 RepID=A0A1U7N2B1_9CYAN|nr:MULTISPECIES: hypothetical protein [Moorena]NEO19532.1 hypothetical protein [Moorena sp. SIO4A5]NEO42888.1 hypothetical protein [Moorena sp. SIO4A3]OLT60066.1 hypothetical protein BJP37_14555 [Moorena bouillonii PNG]
MATGESPTCDVISSEMPYWENNRLIFPFLINDWKHVYYIDFPLEFKNTQKPHISVLIGIAMAEIYRLCEICTPQIVQVPWYSCLPWESDWWNEDIYWYLQQKFYLEKWSWDRMPRIEFSRSELENSWSPSVKDSYLLAVSGGKESTFAFEWMQRANLTMETFTLHHAGGILGDNWQKKFPVFEPIRKRSHLWEILTHPREDPAQHFDYKGVRNDPTITNALFVMMIIAAQQGHKFLVLANDKSSNESNATYQGRSVNHQSAKGNAYIERFNDFLERKGLPFRYVSICEEVYSIATVQQLSLWNKSILKDLTSCNEAQWAPGSSRWCCGCPKCAFSFALIEAATDYDFAIDVVGEDLFSVKKLEELWTRLFDPRAEKPFECVGEKRETLMALVKCKQQRIKNGQPLGALAEIPDVKFDNSLLMISPPKNIPMPHRDKLESVCTFRL